MQNRLPVKRSLRRAFMLSLIVVVITAVASIIGLVYQTTSYPTEELRQSYLSNDVINLIIGLPILLGSMWIARRGRLIGLLLWSGALLYGIYNYTAYVFGIPISLSTVMHLAIVLLSAYTVFDLLKNTDSRTVQAQLTNAVPVKTAGWILVLFGIMFFLRAIGMIVDAAVNQTTLPSSELGVLAADIIISPLWIAGGVLLLRRMPIGYASGLGLLFTACMLIVGLILILFLQPVLTDAPFVLIDVIIIAVMGLIFFIPFGLFVRGVMLKG